MAERMVTEWGKQHRRELQEAWRRVESHRNPGKIAVKVVAHTGMEMITVEEMAKHP